MAKYRVYLDNCAYNRPFDDQTHIKIALETEAKRHIQLDYTEWSRKHYEDVDLHEFNMRAVAYDRTNPVRQA